MEWRSPLCPAPKAFYGRFSPRTIRGQQVVTQKLTWNLYTSTDRNLWVLLDPGASLPTAMAGDLFTLGLYIQHIYYEGRLLAGGLCSLKWGHSTDNTELLHSRSSHQPHISSARSGITLTPQVLISPMLGTWRLRAGK